MALPNRAAAAEQVLVRRDLAADVDTAVIENGELFGICDVTGKVTGAGIGDGETLGGLRFWGPEERARIMAALAEPNLIVNGAMEVSQENGTTAVTSG